MIQNGTAKILYRARHQQNSKHTDHNWHESPWIAFLVPPCSATKKNKQNSKIVETLRCQKITIPAVIKI